MTNPNEPNPFEHLFPGAEVEVHTHALDFEQLASIIPGFADVQTRLDTAIADGDDEAKSAARAEINTLIQENLPNIIMESQLQNMLQGDPTSENVIREADVHAAMAAGQFSDTEDHSDCAPDSPCRTHRATGMMGGYRMNGDRDSYDVNVRFFRGTIPEEVMRGEEPTEPVDIDALDVFDMQLSAREFDRLIERMIGLRATARKYADDVITGKISEDDDPNE